MELGLGSGGSISAGQAFGDSAHEQQPRRPEPPPPPRENGGLAMTQAAATQPGGGAAEGAPLPVPLPLPPPQQQQPGPAPTSAQLPLQLPPPVNGEAAALAQQGVGATLPSSIVPPGDSPHPVLAAGGSGGGGALALSPSSASLASSGAAGADSNRTLYLGNLHPFVSEATLQEVFAGLGGVTELKVIKDKATGVSAGYGFAKFADTASAQAALDRVAKTVLFGQEARINWAFQKEQKEEVAHHFHVFVGDLSSDVTDAMLHASFQACPGCSDARVMWDHATGRSRGYGFVSFRQREEAEAAIQMMHGQFIGVRRVRCGWAQHKTEGLVSMDPQILDRADPTNTNVYVGNLAPNLSDAEVRRQFGAFGTIAEVKLYRKGSYGFVRYKNHADAVCAIAGMNGQALGGKVVKCSWGRHPNTPPSGVQTSLMLAAAAGINPLAMASPAAMLGHGGMGTHLPGVMGMGSAMMGGAHMPMAAAGAQALIHGGGAGMAGMGLAQAGAVSAAMLGSGGVAATGLSLDPSQLQQMAAMPYALPYNGAGMQPNMAFFSAGGAS